MAKRKIKKRKKKKSTSSKFLTYVIWVLSFILVGIIALAIGYYVGYGDAKVDSKSVKQQKLEILKKNKKS